MKIQEFAKKLSGFIPKEKITWAASEADINGRAFLFFKFKPESTSIITNVNLIVKYVPLNDEILWGEIEFIISPNLGAVKFMEELYPELISLGFKVVVDSDGIFASYKLGQEFNESVINHIYEKLCKVLGIECGSLIFRGVVTVGEG